MTKNSYHYLFQGGSDATDFNKQMFKLRQQPTSWVNKGKRLKRDASLFYEKSESSRLFIVSELKKKNFNFSRFYRWKLQEIIMSILEENQDTFLPDFDTYYLLMHLALENILKGLWLDKFPENIGFDKLPNELKTHDLIGLANDISLNLSDQENKLLSKLADLFLGYSRYPIKNRVKHSTNSADLDFGERPYDLICIQCLENPYAEEKNILETLFAESLRERVEQVFQNSHERMQSTFDFRGQQESSESSGKEDK